MIRTRILAISLFLTVLSAPFIHAQDLSLYRGFRFGIDLPSLAKQIGVKPSEAKTIHQRPALIQELEWYPQHRLGDGSTQPDPARDLHFSFYNGELFRIVVNYDRFRTEGLTDADMIEAVSSKYGTPTGATPGVGSSSFETHADSQKVVACWEDAQYSFNLLRSSYHPTAQMVAFSKRLDALARAAIADAIRLDEQDAPQRERARLAKEDEEKRVAEEKARVVNKPTFRP